MVRSPGPARNAGDGRGDDEVEMLGRDRLDDRTADAVLSGRGGQPDGDEPADLAAFVAAVRAEATSASARPNANLAELLARGISADEGDLPVSVASNVHRPATQGVGPPKRRTRRLLTTITASFAALSLAAKTGVASAAVLAATAGAGAAGALPGTAQAAFDDVVRGVGAEQPDADDGERPDVVTGTDDGETPDVVTGTDDTLPHAPDTPEGGVDGSVVSGNAQDEGGVDGEHVADEASDGRSSHGRERAEDARELAPELPEEAHDGQLPDAADRGERPGEVDARDRREETGGTDADPNAVDDSVGAPEPQSDAPEPQSDAPEEQPDAPVEPSARSGAADTSVEARPGDSAPRAPGSQGDRLPGLGRADP